MKKYMLIQLMIVCSSLVHGGKLVTYEAPEGMDAAQEYEVEVNGQQIFVYNTRTAAFTYFSFEGKVDIKVTYRSPVYHYDIRPKSREIQSELYRNQVSFSLEEPEIGRAHV